MENKDSFINELQQKIKTKDLTGIIEGLDLVISIHPDNNHCANLYKYRACLKIQLGDYFSALSDLNKLLILSPDDIEAFKLKTLLELLVKKLRDESPCIGLHI